MLSILNVHGARASVVFETVIKVECLGSASELYSDAGLAKVAGDKGVPLGGRVIDGWKLMAGRLGAGGIKLNGVRDSSCGRENWNGVYRSADSTPMSTSKISWLGLPISSISISASSSTSSKGSIATSTFIISESLVTTNGLADCWFQDMEGGINCVGREIKG